MQGFHQSMSEPSKLPERSAAHKAALTRLWTADDAFVSRPDQ
jgi:hypothetical protein